MLKRIRSTAKIDEAVGNLQRITAIGGTNKEI
jgi:hypothetical protein